MAITTFPAVQRADGDLSAIPLGEERHPTLHAPTFPDCGKAWLALSFGRLGARGMDGPEAVQTTLEQIDLGHQMVAMYPDDFALALTADDATHPQAGEDRLDVGMEGGYSIGSSHRS